MVVHIMLLRLFRLQHLDIWWVSPTLQILKVPFSNYSKIKNYKIIYFYYTLFHNIGYNGFYVSIKTLQI